MSIKQKAISGVKWTTMSMVVANILQLLQLSILARYLDPSAFGLMAIVMVVIRFSQAFLDMGISNAIIHKQDITQNQLSTLYWLNIIAGIILFLIIVIISPLVATFYDEPELKNLIVFVGLLFLIQPFGQQFMILLQKELKFEAIAKINITYKLIALLVSVVLAMNGYGVYALVYGELAGVISQTLLFLFIGRKQYKPSFVFSIIEVREFLSFGAYQMGEKTINYFNSQIDVILIGKLLGVEALGIYSVAKQLIMRPMYVINPIVTKVAFPVMSKFQNDVGKLKDIYLKIINLVSSINFPIYVFLFVFAHEIVWIMFGEKWLNSVLIIQILSFYGAIRVVGNPIGVLLLARGRADIGFYWNLFTLFYIPLGVYLSSQWGLEGVAYGLVLIILSLKIPEWFFLVRTQCNAKFWEYHIEMIKPFVLSIMVGFFVYLVTNNVDQIFIKLLIGLIFGAILVLILNWLFNKKFIKQLMELKNGN